MLKFWVNAIGLLALTAASGCAPLLVGAGAAGVYKVAQDERSVGRIVDDSNISATIKLDLSRDPVVNAPDIDVDVIDGHVILSGIMTSEEQIDRAMDIAGRIEGVKSVRNNLRVGSRTVGEFVGDKVIASKIKTKLIGESGIPSTNIDVDAHKGVVTLTGIVSNRLTKERVLKIAKETKGTVQVIDNLIVENE
ncbi:MAG: BON domain-containing protein [Desulfobacterales bacterium]